MSVYEVKMVRPYVYYDERYPSHWIAKAVAKRMANALKKVGFKIVNAEEVRDLMQEALRTPLREEIVIVFSQDVVPDILVDNPSSPTANSLLRRFLNRGHSIVWMGDVPLLHVGFNDGRKQSLTPGVVQHVLGLSPEIPNVKAPVRHTYLGWILQLPIWVGTRPHKGLAPGISGVGFHHLSLSSHGVHAFIVSYYGQTPFWHPVSGFIRLYDMMLNRSEVLSDEIIRGIVNVVFRNPLVSIQKSLDKLYERVREIEESLNTKFETLRSELDNLGKILDKILKLAEEKSKARKTSG